MNRTNDDSNDDLPLVPPLPPGGLGNKADTNRSGKSASQIPPGPPPISTVSEEEPQKETQQQKEERENAINCEMWSNKLHNEFHEHYKIIIDKIVENDNKLLVQCKAKDKVYYYLATHVKNNLDEITHRMESIRFTEPNCMKKIYKSEEDYRKDYKPEMTISMDGKEKKLLLQNFGSVENMKKSIIPFNDGSKYLGARGDIVGYSGDESDEAEVVILSDEEAKEFQDLQSDLVVGGKKKKKKKKRNNKTNRRKKKKNGTKKKRN